MTEETRDRVSRRQFIRLGAALGVGAAASSALAACGGTEAGGSGGGSGGSGGSTSQGSSSEGASAQSEQGGGSSAGAIARTDEVQPGSAVTFEDSGNDAVLVHLQDGDFVAYSAVCTHQGCTVAYRDAQLVCPCHGSIFDPAGGGQVVTGPAEAPLPEIPVEVRGGEVFKA